jgi:hypothetical protein
MEHSAAHDHNQHQPGVELPQIVLPKDYKDSTADGNTMH